MAADSGGFETVIEPGAGFERYWRDLWTYRELFFFLAWRDILVRYKQTVFGVSWSVLRPLLTMAAFTLVFGKLAALPSGDVPYPVLVYAGLLPWQLFSSSLSEGSNALVANASMITKVYFPRLIVVGGSIVVNLVDFLISSAVFLLLMAWYRVVPGPGIAALPLFLLLGVIVSLGFCLWLAALTVKYRDFRHVVPFLVQAGLYISPVGFSSAIIPERWRLLYSLNPIVGVVDGFRWSLLGGENPFYWPGFLLSVVISIVLLVTGYRYFRGTERSFADVL